MTIPRGHRRSRGDWFLAEVVDIAEDIDFIHMTEAVGIIAGGNGLSPF